MTHAHAPSRAEGRRRLIERCRTRPITHVAAERGRLGRPGRRGLAPAPGHPAVTTGQTRVTGAWSSVTQSARFSGHSR